jgi:hypothetical protein
LACWDITLGSSFDKKDFIWSESPGTLDMNLSFDGSRGLKPSWPWMVSVCTPCVLASFFFLP